MIEQAENILRDLGFYDVRVRHHELSSQFQVSSVQPEKLKSENSKLETHRSLARIEVGADEMPRFLQDGNWSKVAEALRKIGYAHVTLDLQGYRRGSLNETSGSSVSFSAPQEAGNMKP